MVKKPTDKNNHTKLKWFIAIIVAINLSPLILGGWWPLIIMLCLPFEIAILLIVWLTHITYPILVTKTPKRITKIEKKDARVAKIIALTGVSICLLSAFMISYFNLQGGFGTHKTSAIFSITVYPRLYLQLSIVMFLIGMVIIIAAYVFKNREKYLADSFWE